MFYQFGGENIPDDLFSNITFYLSNSSDDYSGMFRECYYLKKVPLWFSNMAFTRANFTVSAYATPYDSCFQYCRRLNEITLPLVLSPVSLDSNAFTNTFKEVNSARKIVFAPSPESDNDSCNWKRQVIDLTSHVGYADGSIGDSSKKIYDATTYAALKNDPDAWTEDITYSFYNHDSAVETLNSLPFTGNSASQSSPNIIKFKGESGSATDGGAINTLTTAEIAQAANRCWSVSYV